MRKWIDAIALYEARRGLAPIGELRAKVFWNPRHEDMVRMLAKSTLGDLRGSFIVTETERLLAIWPARNLSHWNFHNECFQREGIDSGGKMIDLRIVRDISVLSEERYWKRETHYAGDGFYCAFAQLNKHVGDPLEIPELKALFGSLRPV